MAEVQSERIRPAFTAVSAGSSARGIASLVLGIAVFSLQDVIIKLVSGAYPISEVLFIRAVTALPLLLAVVHLDGGIGQIAGPGLWRMLVRGLVMITAFSCYYLAIAVMPLADATAILFTAPLFITLLSGVLLGERVGPRRWLAVIAGFGGVALMVRPGSGLFSAVAILPLLAALAYAASQLMARAMPQEVRASTMSFHGNLVFLAGSALAAVAFGDGRHAVEEASAFAFLLRGWAMPDGRDLLLMAACGPIGAFGLVFLARAYRQAPASVVAPFEFTAILWGILWGFAIWHDAPSWPGLAGMALIAAAGLSVMVMERAAGEPFSWLRAHLRRAPHRRQRRNDKGGAGQYRDKSAPTARRTVPSVFDRLPGSPTAKGIACMLLGIAVFSLQDVVIKLTAGTYPVAEAMTIRSLVALPILLFMVHLGSGLSSLASRNWDWLTARALVLLNSYFLYYLAIPAMPLAAVVALYYVSPLFITALAVPVLGEHVGWRRWSAIAAGFAGVLVMLRPDHGLADPAALLPVFAAFCYASGQVITRHVAGSESAAVMAFYHNLMFLLSALLLGALFGDGALAGTANHPSLAFLLRGWVWPSLFDLLLLASCGLVAASGLWLLTQAYRQAQANLVAFFEYTGLMWATLWGFLLWHEVPGAATIAGGALVVAAGIYVLVREKKLGERSPQRPRAAASLSGPHAPRARHPVRRSR
jgi:drug/metabolite transporter (DMT)-like permease